MPLTAEERAEIRRQNGRKSRGPTTDEGKEVARRNALKHGLRAEALPPPVDDPEAARARHEEWRDYYCPRSPAARHLVDQCVRATLMADRSDAYHHAALSQKIRTAEVRWDDDRADEVARYKAMLVDDPATAVRLLRRTGHGCRWMIRRWEFLGRLLDSQGSWWPDERAEAIRLLGEHPEPLRTAATAPALLALLGMTEPERARYSHTAFAIHLCCLACQPDRPADELARLLEEGRAPYSINGGRRPEALPQAAGSLAELRQVVADELKALRPLEERLRTEFDEPDRAEAPRRALIEPDRSAESRLFLRYHAESRASFHRAFRELTRVLKDDASRDAEFDSEVLLEKELMSSPPAASPAPASAESPPPYDPDLARRQTVEIYMRNVGWPNGATLTLEEAYRAAGLDLPDEPEADPGVSPNEPEAGPGVSPNEPEAGASSDADRIATSEVAANPGSEECGASPRVEGAGPCSTGVASPDRTSARDPGRRPIVGERTPGPRVEGRRDGPGGPDAVAAG